MVPDEWALLVIDENELNAVAGVFEDLLEDVQFVQDDE